MKKIKVTYPDSEEGEIYTLEELRDKFRDEEPGWVEMFIQQINIQGFAYTRMGGKYELVK